MTPVRAKIVAIDEKFVTVSVLNEDLLADFELAELIVPAGEKLELGYVVDIDEVKGRARFVIQGGVWTKEDVDKFRKAGAEMAERLEEISNYVKEVKE